MYVKDGREFETVHVGLHRVLGCQPHLAAATIIAFKWEDIEPR